MLGIVKHLIGIELGYLGSCLGRPPKVTLPWYEDGSVWDGADMWVTPNESSDYLVELYRAAWAHSDSAFDDLSLAAPAHVEWWSEGQRDTTFGHLAVRVVAETAHHGGHCDILRESVDGRGGTDHDSVGDEAAWSTYVATIQAAADPFKS